ncbi:SDR family NAD(P)-dependent oxidoreductase [Agromyces indicus]|uniref:SDR family NAD(P)-dependent oxidoreductase n=1 Tax=Agromyces indicus TaxID=758919 RepID=A0ABU1FHQ1_9MICO|nr:SDR family NAD(P)-dependent oxidoreductase [Agromyces indicus]MDR5691279.1 SDR family NAD(P)-dependent oxidoreductase [Agromyces indicus]
MTQTDITSPTVLLTGPTSGIGAGMLRHLVRHPSRPRLVLLGRDAVRTNAATAVARDAGLTAHTVHTDLADLDSVAAALEDVRALQADGQVGSIDAAVLNAGTQFTDRRRRGAQGWELTFTVNVIAQHLLLRGIRPLLAPDGHVVLLGSSTHRGKRASFNLVPDPVWQAPADLATAAPPATGEERFADEREQGGIAYASSKLALVTLSNPWAAQLAADGRRLNTYDPGLVAGTGLGRDMPGYMYWVWRRLMPAMSLLPGATTPNITARHAVELALGDAHRDLHGGYVEIGRVTQAAPSTRIGSRQDELWSWLEQATAPFVPAWAGDELAR